MSLMGIEGHRAEMKLSATSCPWTNITPLDIDCVQEMYESISHALRMVESVIEPKESENKPVATSELLALPYIREDVARTVRLFEASKSTLQGVEVSSDHNGVQLRR